MSSDGRERIQSIFNQLAVWWEQANWTNAEKADRSFQALQEQGLDKFLDPLPGVPFNEAVTSNYESLKDEFGLRTQTEEFGEQRDIESRQRRRAVGEAEDQIREFGLSAVADAFEERGPDALVQRVNDLLAEWPPDVYDQAAFNEATRALEQLSVDVELISEERLETLQEQEPTGDPTQEQLRAAENRVLNALERRFGQRFEDIDDAVNRIQQRIAQARGERLRISEITVRRSGDDFLVFIDSDDAAFQEYKSLVRDRVVNLLAVNQLSGAQRMTVGEIRLRGGDLEAIDLQQGLDRLGPAAEHTETAVREELEQAMLDLGNQDRTPEAIMDEAIRLLKMDGDEGEEGANGA